jgi:hypothetical protein
VRLIDDTGQELDAEFDLEQTSEGIEVVLHSRSGGSGSATRRNSEYFTVLEAILSRLSMIGAKIARTSVDSSVARQLPIEQRTIDLAYPIRLSESTDSLTLRRQMTEGQRKIASKGSAGEHRGNNHKRIRIAVDLRATGVEAAQLPELLRTARASRPSALTGVSYRRAKANPTVRPADVFTFDPAQRERSLSGHARTQNALADFLAAAGLTPMSPGDGDPDFDLAWVDDRLHVAEVKSLSGADPVRQLRLGVGQVLHYRHVLAALHGDAVAVLAVEYEPPSLWLAICRNVGVILTWPTEWPNLAWPNLALRLAVSRRQPQVETIPAP